MRSDRILIKRTLIYRGQQTRPINEEVASYCALVSFFRNFSELCLNCLSQSLCLNWQQTIPIEKYLVNKFLSQLETLFVNCFWPPELIKFQTADDFITSVAG